MADSEAFWNRIAAKYARKPVKDVAAYEDTLARTRAHLSAGDRVLEVGCGTGTTALRLADAVAHVTATDLATGMIAIAREKARAEGIETVTFATAPLAEGKGPQGPFDAVLAFNLLHLVDDLPAALCTVSDRLVPGGRFVSKTPCIGDAPRVLRALLPLMRAVGLAPPVAALTVEALDAAVAEAGFEIVERGIYGKTVKSRFLVARRP